LKEAQLGAAHPGLKPVLNQLHDEHEVVAALIRRLEEVLEASGDEGATHVEVVSHTLADQLLSHLSYEESQLVAVLDSTPGQPGGPPRP